MSDEMNNASALPVPPLISMDCKFRSGIKSIHCSLPTARILAPMAAKAGLSAILWAECAAGDDSREQERPLLDQIAVKIQLKACQLKNKMDTIVASHIRFSNTS